MIGPEPEDKGNDLEYSLAAAAAASAHSGGSGGASSASKGSSSGLTTGEYNKISAFNYARDRAEGPGAGRRWFPGGSHVGVKNPPCWHKRCELSDTFRDLVKIVMAKLNESQSAVARHFSNIGHVFMTQGTSIVNLVLRLRLSTLADPTTPSLTFFFVVLDTNTPGVTSNWFYYKLREDIFHKATSLLVTYVHERRHLLDEADARRFDEFKLLHESEPVPDSTQYAVDRWR